MELSAFVRKLRAEQRVGVVAECPFDVLPVFEREVNCGQRLQLCGAQGSG